MSEQPLVGRAAELGRLAGWVAEVSAGYGRAALVEGEPGIGKSALLHEAIDAAAKAGCAVYSGKGEELGQAFPLQPLLEAFDIRHSVADPRRRAVLETLHAQHNGAAAAAAEALLDLIDDLCAQAPALLVVDDLHWADPTTVAVCHRLARTAAQRRLLLIGAMRPLPRREDLKALRAAAGRDHVLSLGPLPVDAVSELVAGLAGGRPGPGLLRLAGDAAGNPLYVTELVAALGRGDGLARTRDTVEVTGGPAPATLTEAITDRLRFLPETTRQVLQAAALLGGEFTADDLAVVTARHPAELAAPLADARAAGVLVEAGRRMAFRHPLIRAALYNGLPATVRAAWHREAARALLQAGAGPERVAGQLLPGLDSDDQVRAGLDNWVIGWLLDVAADLAGEAAEAAVRLLRAAVAQLPAADTRRHLLVSHLARALGHQAEYEKVEALASRTLPHVTDPDVLVDLFDALTRARSASLERLPETLAAIDHALATAPRLTAVARNRLQTIASRAHYRRSDLDNAERTARPALAEAQASSDAYALAWSANTLACVRSDRGDSVGALEYADQGLAAAEGQPELIDADLLLLLNRVLFLVRLDRFDDARTTVTAARALAERVGNIRRLTQAQMSLCELSYETGRWDDALAEADQVEGVGDAIEECLAHAIAALIYARRHQLPAAREHLAAGRPLARQVGYPETFWVRADALGREVVGDLAGALAVFTTALAGTTRPVETEAWLAHIVRLALGQDDRSTAVDVTGRAEDFAATAATPSRIAVAAHCRGLLDADPALLLQAADGYAAAIRPLSRAQALEAAAALLAEHGDVGAARAPCVAALDGYAALGATWDLTQARARFRPYGLRQPTRRSTRPATGWEALTPAEAKVADLVAQGLSNPEIAKQLVVARATVEYHVAKVLAKLQVRSRVDIARAAAARPAQPVA